MQRTKQNQLIKKLIELENVESYEYWLNYRKNPLNIVGIIFFIIFSTMVLNIFITSAFLQVNATVMDFSREYYNYFKLSLLIDLIITGSFFFYNKVKKDNAEKFFYSVTDEDFTLENIRVVKRLIGELFDTKVITVIRDYSDKKYYVSTISKNQFKKILRKRFSTFQENVDKKDKKDKKIINEFIKKGRIEKKPPSND